MFKKIIMAMIICLPLSAQATSIELNFGDTVNNNFGASATNLVMNYSNVSSYNDVVINASITATSVFDSKNGTKNGSVANDIRINMDRGDANVFTLSLWDASKGNGFDTLFTASEDFDWTLGFYDIDGASNSFDVVTLFDINQYSVTSTTALVVDNSQSNQISFSGVNAKGDVKGQDGLGAFITQQQADVALFVTYQNLSEVTFAYEHGPASKDNSGRNLLIDGGGLKFAPKDGEVVVTVPTPNMFLLFATAMLALLTVKRKSS
ncbi:hypothetical protein [uncultured Paraglaciecola sp.]|uniref:hypothetical protein n=1 Tax=uncultured Paraglaciecola sp. TaxID=1765024 RepID=UPI00260947C3|nr:hypothetical protein [uncultured Paraglaciecola sp.]